jgi:uncharacterized surface protein with fasciclin (FAS1) repeats
MTKFRRSLLLTMASFAAFCLLATVPAAAFNDPKSPKNLVETAAEAGNFETLKKALKATGLDETLKKGNYTVFAPTDEAFAKLPEGTLEKLMNDKEALKKILLYHVVEGTVKAADVVGKTEVKTVEGSSAKIKAKNGKVKIDKARIIQTDISAANGVIHAIDAVIMPSAETK